MGAGNGSPTGFGPGGSPTGTPTPPVDPDDDVAAVMYATDGTNIQSFSIASDGTLAVLRRNLEPEGNISKLVLGPSGDRLYATDYFGDRLYSYALDIAEGSLSPLGPGIPGGNFPNDLRILGTEFAYVTNANAAGSFGTNTIRSFLINAAGQLEPNAASPPLPTRGIPGSIAFSPGGNKLFVASSEGPAISQYEIGPGGVLSPSTPPIFPTVGRSRFSVVSRDGRFLFLTLYSGEGATTGLVNTYAFGPSGDLTLVDSTVWNGPTPQNLVQHPSLSVLYVAGDDQIQAFTIDTNGVLTHLGAPAAAEGAFSLAFDPSGRFLYASGNFVDQITYFSVDPSTGTLTPLGILESENSASFVIVPGPDA